MDYNNYQRTNNNDNSKLNTIVIAILAFFIGAGAFYAVLKLYPTVFIKETTKLEKNVTINDTGLAESVEKVYDSVVVVSTYKNGKGVASGTGFVYKKDGNKAFIMTNNHVIEDGNQILVTFTNQKETEVTVVGSDKYADIAVLSVDSDEIISVAELGSSKDARIGDTAFAVGAPLDNAYSWTVTRGIVSGKDRLVEVSTSNSSSSDWVMSVLQTDAAINSGNSGGPLANANGEVIGVTSLKLVSNGVEGMGFAIPIETALDYANKIINGEEISQPYLGIYMINVADAYYSREYYNILSALNVTSGVLVTDVEKGSDAEKGGLQKDDVIIKVDDTEISSLAYFRYVLYSHSVGDTISVTVNRNGVEKVLSVALETKKTN
ncbi:MAG: trypsin-like peptidase domain-containing protein [Bacilli bacterium]|nr:trypsin-like peptidase domain-containing protein [Bacilli bacterium]